MKGHRWPFLAAAAVLIVLLAFTMWAVAHTWAAAGIDIGWFGWAVLGVGGALTIGLGVGLMALSFHSARAGFDARAQDAAAEIERSLDRARAQGD